MVKLGILQCNIASFQIVTNAFQKAVVVGIGRAVDGQIELAVIWILLTVQLHTCNATITACFAF